MATATKPKLRYRFWLKLADIVGYELTISSEPLRKKKTVVLRGKALERLGKE